MTEPEWQFTSARKVQIGDHMRHGEITEIIPGELTVVLRSDRGVSVMKHPYAPVEIKTK